MTDSNDYSQESNGKDRDRLVGESDESSKTEEVKAVDDSTPRKPSE